MKALIGTADACRFWMREHPDVEVRIVTRIQDTRGIDWTSYELLHGWMGIGNSREIVASLRIRVRLNAS